MAQLVFKVHADYEKVIKLRDEISKLKQELRGIDSTQSPDTFNALNGQLRVANTEFTTLTSKTAQAGATMESGFKKKIFDASQVVNDLSQNIINQKGVVKGVEADVRRLGEAYQTALRKNPMNASGKLSEYNSARKALEEERATLFGLTQDQANARLSVKKLRDEYALYKGDIQGAGDANKQMSLSLGKIIGVVGGVAAVKQLGSEIIRVRGEFQSMQTAMETMVGKDMAGSLMKEVKEYAKISPLTLSDMVGAEKMMLGFDIPAQDTVKYLKALGDVSMGNSQKFNSLTLAFSQMSATGKLMGQDLNQMINAGFNPLTIMSEKSGKSISQLKDEMSKGAISAEMVQQAFVDATSAGGKFYNMSENASKTINGQISMMEDAWEAALNSIGTNSEGVIISSIQGVTGLIENYETVGKVITGLVVTYGVYRAATMLNTMAAGKHTIAEIALTNARVVARNAQMALNAAMLTNPYVAIAVALAATTAAVWALSDSSTAAEKAQKRFNEEQEVFGKQQEERKQKTEELIRVIQDETETSYAKIKAYEELKKWSPALVSAYNQEEIALVKLADAQKICNNERDKIDYSQTIETIDQLSSRLKSLRDEHGKFTTTIIGGEVVGQNVDNSGAIAIVESKLKLEKDKLKKLDDLKKEVEEKNKPLDIRIIEAKADLDQIQKEFDDVKNKLEEEQAKLKDSPLSLPPFALQADFGTIQNALKKQQQKVAGLESENKKTTTYDEDFKTAKKDWEDAKKKLSEIEKDKSKFTTKQYGDAKKLKESTEKTFKDIGGKTESSSIKTDSYVNSYQREKEIKRYALSIKDAISSSEFDIQQQQIDIMDEGMEKQIEQINLNYDKKYQEIQKEERELLQKLQDEEYRQWERENPDYKKKNLQFSPMIKSLDSSQSAIFDQKYSLIDQKMEKDTQILLKQMLDKYKDYNAQKTTIEEEGNKEILFLQKQRTEFNAEEIDRAIKVAQEKIKEGVQSVNDAQAAKSTEDSSFLKNLFGDTSRMAFDDLRDLIDQAKQLRKYLSGGSSAEGITFISPDQLKAIEKSPSELDKLKKALDNTLSGRYGDNAFGKIFEQFEDGFDKLKEAKGPEEVSGAIATIGGVASSAAGELANMFEQMGDTKTADAISGVQQVMSTISNIGQGFAKGGIVGGIAAAVGEAANFIGQAFAASARHKSALKEIMDESISQQREYNLLLLQQNLEYEKANTIFGADAYAKASNAVVNMKKSLSALSKELEGTNEQQDKFSYKIESGFLGKFKNLNYSKQKDTYSGLADVQIKTGHKKTGMFGWGKGKDTYSSILDVYPKLVDANGKFDQELAKTILNTRTMSDESKAALQSMIDTAQQAEDAYNELNSYLTDIFGDLGNTMTDALVDAFKNGTDAGQAFTNSVSGMLETLAKQMIYSVTLAPLMEQAQKKMTDVMHNTDLSDDQKFNQLTGVLDNLVDDAISQQGVANKLMQEYQDKAKEKGIEIFKKETSTQSATKKGFDTMSQETGNELNGRFTDLQMTTRDIRSHSLGYTKSFSILTIKAQELALIGREAKDIAGETRSILVNSYLELMQISQNTGAIIKPIKEMNEKLDKIRDNTDRL